MATKTPPLSRKQVYDTCLSVATVVDPKETTEEKRKRAERMTNLFMGFQKKGFSRQECLDKMDDIYKEKMTEEEKKQYDYANRIIDKTPLVRDELDDPEESNELSDVIQIAAMVKKVEDETEIVFSRNCSVCHIKNDPPKTTLKTCNTCRKIWYCSREHQVEDWPRHKAEHIKI